MYSECARRWAEHIHFVAELVAEMLDMRFGKTTEARLRRTATAIRCPAAVHRSGCLPVVGLRCTGYAMVGCELLC
jgi:hypothetical protein